MVNGTWEIRGALAKEALGHVLGTLVPKERRAKAQAKSEARRKRLAQVSGRESV